MDFYLDYIISKEGTYFFLDKKMSVYRLSKGTSSFNSMEVEKVKNGWSVKTEKGQVLADKVIMCTGAYTNGGWKGLDKTFSIQKVFVAATNSMPKEVRNKVLPFNGTMHDGRGDIFVYKYDGKGRLVVSMFPIGKRGKDQIYTKKILLDRLRWLHPSIPKDTIWEYFWFGELFLNLKR